MKQRHELSKRPTLIPRVGPAGHQEHRGWLETHQDLPPCHHGNCLCLWPWYLKGEPLGSSRPPFPRPFPYPPSGYFLPKGLEPLVQVPLTPTSTPHPPAKLVEHTQLCQIAQSGLTREPQEQMRTEAAAAVWVPTSSPLVHSPHPQPIAPRSGPSSSAVITV